MKQGTITMQGDHRFDGLSIIESVLIDKVDPGSEISRCCYSMMLNNGKVLVFVPYKSTSGSGVELKVFADGESFKNYLNTFL